MKSTAPYIIIILLLLTIFLQRECHRCPEVAQTTTDTIVIRDTTIVHLPPITPKPGRIEYVQLPAIIDTAAIIRDYFARRFGEDTLIDTRDLFLSLKWEVQENKPTYFQPTIINRKPTTIITHTLKPRTQYYAGFATSGNQHRLGLSPTIAINTKQQNFYTLSFDIINKEAAVGMLWKINLKKP
jgi:hypothetical protein